MVTRTGVRRLGLLVLLLHPDEGHGDLLEEALDVVAGFCRRFHEHDVKLRRLLVCLLQCYLPIRLLVQVLQWIWKRRTACLTGQPCCRLAR